MNEMNRVDRLHAFEAAISDGQMNLFQKHQELLQFQENLYNNYEICKTILKFEQLFSNLPKQSRVDVDGTIEREESKLADLKARFDRDKSKINAYEKFIQIKKKLELVEYQELDLNKIVKYSLIKIKWL